MEILTESVVGRPEVLRDGVGTRQTSVLQGLDQTHTGYLMSSVLPYSEGSNPIVSDTEDKTKENDTQTQIHTH